MSAALDFATELRLIENALGILEPSNVTQASACGEPRIPAAAAVETGLLERRNCSRVAHGAPTACVSGRPSTPLAEGREISAIFKDDSQPSLSAVIETAPHTVSGMNHALSILERPRPRLGANVIVVDGRNVDVWVEEHAGEYRASEMDYDEGRPVAMRSSIAAALHDLRTLLMDEITECTACTDGECDNCDEVDL